MNNLQNIRILSNRLIIVLWAVLIINPIFTLIMWFGSVYMPNNELIYSELSFPIELPLSAGHAIMGYLVINLTVIVASLITWQLIKLFQRYSKGEIFGINNIHHYKAIGNLVILYVLVGCLDGLLLGPALTYGQQDMSFTFDIADSDVALLISGIIIRLIAQVMTEAKELHDEQSLTI
ncbi:DUF2975 domain-containing protein [Vibrio coralliirubri]|uniref:DUF2975 domain-containing protein n=1 Tax=Vibrio coralliirubri TaxID=1516159 RepID=UPI0006392562|nr:DUF2975 domain-containing protein [Vibrio coralliirubri]CDT52037.1 conserved membrane hypothetical protein [Vibrio coralliirubri]